MAIALLQNCGSHYDQVLIVSHPLFMRRLLDHADEQRVDWQKYHVRLVLGEEMFGEQFRSHIAGRLATVPTLARSSPRSASASSDVTCALKRRRRSPCGEPRFGIHVWRASCSVNATPCPWCWPTTNRTLIESIDLDQQGFGRMTVSMLDPTLSIPSLRYQTGDQVRWLDPSRVMIETFRRGFELNGQLPPMLAFAGRNKERQVGVSTYEESSSAAGALFDLHPQSDAERPPVLRNRILQV